MTVLRRGNSLALVLTDVFAFDKGRKDGALDPIFGKPIINAFKTLKS
jgi:hypothetical protein